MKVSAIEVVLDNEAAFDEFTKQIENQCIQTVVLEPAGESKTPDWSLRITPMFGDELAPELLELLHV